MTEKRRREKKGVDQTEIIYQKETLGLSCVNKTAFVSHERLNEMRRLEI